MTPDLERAASKNGDEPANVYKDYERYGGLTKREAFAMAAMQGLLAGDERHADNYDTLKEAVELADGLLVLLELERSKRAIEEQIPKGGTD